MAEKTSTGSLLPARNLLSAIRAACDRSHISSLKRRIEICTDEIPRLIEGLREPLADMDDEGGGK